MSTLAHRPIPVRVVSVGEKRGVGGLVALAGVIGTLTHPEIGGNEGQAWFLQLFILMWCVGTVLTYRARPRTVMARFDSERQELKLGDDITLSMMTTVDASVARGEKGFSIAIDTKSQSGGKSGEPIFVEVENEDDARAFLASLDIPWPGTGSVEVVTRNENLRRGQRIVGALGILALIVGAITQLALPEVRGANDPTNVLGPIAVVATLISTLIAFFDPLLRRRFKLGMNQRAAKGPPATNTVVDAHVRAHLQNRLKPEASTKEDDGEDVPSASAIAGVRVLDRGKSETTQAWLARIDALSGKSEGYRGGGLSEEELWQIVEDAQAPERARLGAARILGRRAVAKDGKGKGNTAAAVIRTRVAHAFGDDAGDVDANTNEAQRIRVLVEEDNVDAAAAELDEIGPTFRAKHREV